MKPEIIKYFSILIAVLAFGGSMQVYAETVEKEIMLEVIVIDPGHGGKDYGTSVSGIHEKDIVLDIGLKLGLLISKAYPEIKILYTRKSDVFIPLNKRTEIANENKAGLFLSIHANYVGVSSVSGTETFVLGHHRSLDNLEVAKKENAVILLEDNYKTTYEGFDPNLSESYIMFELLQDEYLGQSLQMATFIQDQFKNKAKRNDRGVKQAGFLVLRETAMPSVLVETGFLSNNSEKEYLNSESGRQEIAFAIFEAFDDYKKIIEERSSYTLNITEQDKNTNKIPNDINYEQIKENTDIKNSSKSTEDSNKKEDSVNANKIEPELKTKSLTPEIEPIQENSENIESGICFTVQLAVSSKQVKLAPENFKGENDVYLLKVGTNYKYFKGKFDNYEAAVSEKERLRVKFNDAFIVAFEDNEPISINKAISKTNQ